MALIELPPFAVVFPHVAVTLLFLSYCVEYIFFFLQNMMMSQRILTTDLLEITHFIMLSC